MKKGWQKRTLGEVCQFRGGGTPSKTVERYWRGDIPWVSPKDMKFDVVSDSIDHISQEAIDGSATSMIPRGSVLMVVRSGILARTVPIAITGRDLTINQDLKALCPNGAMDARFLYHLLGSKMDVLLSMVSRGATVHRLVTEQIRGLDFALPPLAEQRRIVGVLDAAFAGLARARAAAATNLQNARALFASHLHAVFSQRGKGWVEKRLEECFRLKSGDGLVSKAMKGGRYRVYGGNGIAGTHDEFNLSGNNVIIGRVGALCGNARHIAEEIWLTDNAFKVVDRRFEFDGAFLTYLLNFKDLRSFARQAAQPVISNSSLKDVTLAFPDLADQKRIVTQLDALAAATQRLAALYERKLAALAALRQALLHQAFAGEL